MKSAEGLPSNDFFWLEPGRRLAQDPWLRSGIISLIILVVGGLSLLTKIWRSTPTHVPQDIRISGLDMLQARSLSRTARRLESEGRLGEAANAWFTAIANNPGDAALHESLLLLVLQQKKPDFRSLTFGVRSANWLLQLSGTNEYTLSLAAGALSKAGLHDEVWSMLTGSHLQPSARIDRILAITAFETDRFDLFSKIWKRNETAFREDPDLHLYHDAWLALWGSPGQALSGRQSIEAACQNKDRAAFSLRLQLVIHSQRVDPEAFDNVFRNLKNIAEARVQDHVRSWLFHEYLGNHTQATMAARSADLTPVSVMEASLLLKGWTQLGLSDLVAEFARKQLGNFPSSSRLHLQVAKALLSAQRWDDVRFLVARIRANPRLASALDGYADFLYGCSASGLGQPAEAHEAFRKIGDHPPRDPSLTFEIAKQLVAMKCAEDAIPLLRLLEPTLSSSTNFWKVCSAAANATHEEQLLVSAAGRAFSLSSHDASLALDYGFALAVSRKSPAEAARVTLQALIQAPKSHLAHLCHALALAQNGRFVDALQHLEKAQLDDLPPEIRGQWLLTCFESRLGLQQTSEAAAVLQRINRKTLFPSQRDWLTQIQSRNNISP